MANTLWRDAVMMHTICDGRVVFSVWEPATVPDIGPASHSVVTYREGQPWGLVTTPPDACYAQILAAFPAAATGIREEGAIILVAGGTTHDR